MVVGLRLGSQGLGCGRRVKVGVVGLGFRD